MGGDGSGQWHWNTRTEVESCHVLSCSWLLQNDYLSWDSNIALKTGGITWLNFFKEPIYTLSFQLQRSSESQLIMTLSNTRQRVSLNATPLHFGGVRWWFACPKCGRRCAKLYLPDLSGFACRICHNLTYRSCNDSGHKIMGYTTAQVAKSLKETNWFRYSPWQRKRDRRPDYRDRGARLREIVGDRILL